MFTILKLNVKIFNCTIGRHLYAVAVQQSNVVHAAESSTATHKWLFIMLSFRLQL